MDSSEPSATASGGPAAEVHPSSSDGAAAATAADAGGPLTLDEMLAALASEAAAGSHSAAVLREGYLAQQQVLQWLGALGSRDSISLSEIDAVLLRWLHACYLQASSLAGVFRCGRGTAPPPPVPLAGLISAAGLLAPFIGGVNPANGRLMVGHPTNDDAKAGSLSELIRLAGAALVTYSDYLSRPALSGRIPSDESSLLFASIAIRSCQDEQAARKIEEQAKEYLAEHPWVGRASASAADATAALSTPVTPERGAEGAAGDAASSADPTSPAGRTAEFVGLQGFGVDELRWLMHWARAQLSEQFASVRYILGDRAGHKDSLVAAQQDKLAMLKLVPGSLSTFVIYCRSCLQFQQHKAAYVFSSKGVIVADALGDDLLRSHLLLINATAALLGGGGPTFSRKAVTDSYSNALEARDKALAWLPGPLKPLLDLEPELGIVSKVVSAAAAASEQQESEQDAASAAETATATTATPATATVVPSESDDVLLPVLEALYAVPEPKSLPPGAIEEEEEEEEVGPGGLEGVPEGGEEGEEGESGASGPGGKKEGGAGKAGKARVARTRARK